MIRKNALIKISTTEIIVARKYLLILTDIKGDFTSNYI